MIHTCWLADLSSKNVPSVWKSGFLSKSRSCASSVSCFGEHRLLKQTWEKLGNILRLYLDTYGEPVRKILLIFKCHNYGQWQPHRQRYPKIAYKKVSIVTWMSTGISQNFGIGALLDIACWSCREVRSPRGFLNPPGLWLLAAAEILLMVLQCLHNKTHKRRCSGNLPNSLTHFIQLSCGKHYAKNAGRLRPPFCIYYAQPSQWYYAEDDSSVYRRAVCVPG